MSNYVLYPILEMKGYIIITVAILFLLTLSALYTMGRRKRGMKAFGWQALLLGRTKIELVWMSLGISQIAFVLSMVFFFVPMGTVQLAALILLCGAKGLLTLSPGRIMGEAVFGGLTGTALMAGNLLIDYMKDTGMDIYILLIWALLSLFVIQYSFYFFIKGLERMLQQHERAKQRKLRKRKKQEK